MGITHFEQKYTDYTRRGLSNNIFGRGFDSRRLHHANDGYHLISLSNLSEIWEAYLFCRDIYQIIIYDHKKAFSKIEKATFITD